MLQPDVWCATWSGVENTWWMSSQMMHVQSTSITGICLTLLRSHRALCEWHQCNTLQPPAWWTECEFTDRMDRLEALCKCCGLLLHENVAQCTSEQAVGEDPSTVANTGLQFQTVMSRQGVCIRCYQLGTDTTFSIPTLCHNSVDLRWRKKKPIPVSNSLWLVLYCLTVHGLIMLKGNNMKGDGKSREKDASLNQYKSITSSTTQVSLMINTVSACDTQWMT